MKPREPLPRSTKRIARSPLRPGSRPLARGKPPRARKPDKAKRRWAKHRDPAYQEFVRQQGCVLRILCSDWTAVECHHVKTRGAGGVDHGNCVGLCARHHRQLHDYGRQYFEHGHQIDLLAEARRIEEKYLAEYGVRWLAHQAT